MWESTLWKESEFPSFGTLEGTTHSFGTASDNANSTHAISIIWLSEVFAIAEWGVKRIIEKSGGS